MVWGNGCIDYGVKSRVEDDSSIVEIGRPYF